MERVLADRLSRYTGKQVLLRGWLHRLRRHSRIAFLILRDASGLAQAVMESAAAPTDLLEESVIEIKGDVVTNSDAPGGAEIRNPEVRVIVEAEDRTPFDLYRPHLTARLPTVLDEAAIALRHPQARARWKIAAASMTGFRSTLDRLGFTEIQTPKIVASSTESGANIFELDYFGSTAYLAQSPQLYKQILVGVFERVYEVGPVFRAEPHDTPRHLSEYVSLDAEMGFIDDHGNVMDVLRDALEGMVDAYWR